MDVRDDPRLSPAPAGQLKAVAGDTLLAQLSPLLRALGSSGYRWPIGLLTAGTIAVICANAVGQIRLNAWQRDFYDALAQRHVAAFLDQLLVFAIIAAALLVLVVAQTWLQEMIKVRLREWLTQDLLYEWLAPKRSYLLRFAGPIGANPDQRIHEDTRHLTELSAVLSVGLLQSSLLLMSFIGVLWLLSEQVVFEIGGRSFAIPGYMVWCALAYALGGSWLAWRVGRRLIPLNAERYAREAELRFALVRANEHAEGIALYSGEPDERRMLSGPVEGVLALMRRLVGGLARLTWVTSGYGWLAIVVPILVAAPGYFDGELTFGTLMMVVGAFNQVQQSLRWFVENFSQIADWRATLLRVAAFRDALLAIETLGEDMGRIEFIEHEDSNLVLEDLRVALPDGRAELEQARVEVAPGERVLIVGDGGAGKSTLFRAIAGLWPWGSGTVHLPQRGTMMFMSERPYLPLGTLCAAVCYPTVPGSLDEARVRLALERVDLGRLVPSLDREERWDQVLSMDEQQRLAFARLVLHAPRWVVLDNAMGALDAQHRRLMLSIFEREVADAAVIRIARDRGIDNFYTRTVHLLRRPGGARLRTRPRPRLVPAAPDLAS